MQRPPAHGVAGATPGRFTYVRRLDDSHLARAVPAPGAALEPDAPGAEGALPGLGAGVPVDVPQPHPADADVRAGLRRVHEAGDPELHLLHVRGTPAVD